ncbi:1,2-dihydroxy-3-keto-5-methylthiopentene dioxygenase [Blyttiomyces sp. JEL0837]|nr:1,2-dihydroxy-3-keto-5-methylthiopentene dioxygenase [Blyttiomyces sp. JEL0837]
MTISAWYFNETDEDQRELHQFSPNQPVTLEQLAELGVLHWHIDVEEEKYLEKVDAICTERQYKNRDVINIRKDTLPDYEAKLKIFFTEHIHEDEEIRFILDGSGYFDVRDKNDKWIRIAMTGSEMIILPAGMYHRFTLDSKNYLKAMRLFKEDPKWTPLNRTDKGTDENKYRIGYQAWLKGEAEYEAARQEGAGVKRVSEEAEAKEGDEVEAPAAKKLKDEVEESDSCVLS